VARFQWSARNKRGQNKSIKNVVWGAFRRSGPGLKKLKLNLTFKKRCRCHRVDQLR
jgi:hypothetical protein